MVLFGRVSDVGEEPSPLVVCGPSGEATGFERVNRVGGEGRVWCVLSLSYRSYVGVVSMKHVLVITYRYTLGRVIC